MSRRGISWPVGVTLVTLGVLTAVPSAEATAPSVAPGLYAERSIAVDGATVRRIYDSEEEVVCYVATLASSESPRGYPASRSVAIDCVPAYRDKKPLSFP